MRRVLPILMALATSGAANACPGKRPGWLDRSAGIPDHRVANRIAPSTRDMVLWNGVEISRERLAEYLGIVLTMEPTPFTILDPGRHPNCDLVEQLRQDIEQSGVCGLGGCGEGHGRWSDR